MPNPTKPRKPKLQPAKELASHLPALIPQPKGGALYAGGVIGHKGAGGRPKDAWKARMRLLADRGAQTVETKAVLKDVEHALFLPAWKFAAEQAYGKATEKLEVEGTIEVVQVWEIAGRKLQF